MTSETTRYETHQKDSYNISFGIGGRNNKYNTPSYGKPSKKPGKPRKQRKHPPLGGNGHNNNHYNTDNNDDDDDEINCNHHHAGQSEPPQQEVFQPTPGAYAIAYATPYPYQYPPPPYPNQGGYHGDYHAPGYQFVPHQGGYGNHGRGPEKEVGLVGAAVGLVTFGMYKLLRGRRS